MLTDGGKVVHPNFANVAVTAAKAEPAALTGEGSEPGEGEPKKRKTAAKKADKPASGGEG